MALSIGEILCSKGGSFISARDEALCEGGGRGRTLDGGEAEAGEADPVFGRGSMGCSTRPPRGASSLDEQEIERPRIMLHSMKQGLQSVWVKGIFMAICILGSFRRGLR